MKKLITILLILAFAMCTASFAACRGEKPDPNAAVDIQTPLPQTTSVVRPVPTDAPDFTAAPTAAPTEAPVVTEAPTEAPTQAPTEVPTEAPTDAPTAPPTEDTTEAPTAAPTEAPTTEPTKAPEQDEDQSVLDDAVFIGNSLFVGLYRFGVITHGDFFTKEGLNINTVYTDPADGDSIPIMDMIAQKEYGKAVLFFGTNELGWPSYTSFIQKYSDLLDAIWDIHPNVKIFIVGIPPVTKGYSDKSTNGVTNENINRMNGMLKQLAERREVTYIGVPKALIDDNGCLPDEASSDGIHFNLKYDRIWANYITRKVREAS